MHRIKLKDRQTKPLPPRTFVAIRRTKTRSGEIVVTLLEERDLVRKAPHR